MGSYFSSIAYSESDYFIKLQKYEDMLKQQLTQKQYCPSMGMNTDLHHFKYKEPVKTGFNCNHNLVLDIRSVVDNGTFWQFCYYINMHRNKDNIKQLLSQEHKFNQYFVYLEEDKLSELPTDNNYPCSAISAVLVAEFVSLAEKRNYIKILLSNGFQVTLGDQLLAQLLIYQQFSTTFKQNIVLFLLSDIMPDIKTYTIQNLITYYNPL